jgi:hypothetical protein
MRWFAVLAAALAAAPAALANPGNDVATGHGTINRSAPFVASFRFAAESQPDGRAHGFYTQTLSGPEGPTPFGGVDVDITCLEVYPGDNAVLGGVVTQTTDPRLIGPGWAFWASVHDGRRTDTPDSMSFAFLSNTPEIDFGPAFPSMCDTPLFVNPLPFNPVLTGQITVNG